MSNPDAKPAEKKGNDAASDKDGQFNSLLEVFRTSTAKAMEAALTLSHLAIEHFAKYGNLSYAQRFLDAMPLDYSRKTAFIEWLRDHSPLRVEGALRTGYILSKDKSPDAKPFRVEVAMKVPYWEYAPEKETINFDEKDVVAALKKTINKFRNARHHATTDKATFALGQADMVIRHLEAAVATGKTISVHETANDQTINVAPAKVA